MWGEAIRHTINLMPSWMSIMLTMSLLMGVVLLLFQGVRRFFPSLLHEGNLDLLSTTTKVTSLSYGFFLGFIMTVLWQAYEKADDIVTQEAGHLSVIVDDSYGLDGTDGARMREAVGAYIHALRTKEWPAMRIGLAAPEAAAALANLYRVAQSFAPQSEVAKDQYDSMVGQIKQLYETRILRLALLESPVSDTMRTLITLGYLIDVLLIALILSSHSKMHLALTLLFGMVVAFNIAIASNLDFPFSGDIAVSSQALMKGNLAALSG